MSRRPLVPEAKAALDKLKTEYANEIGIKLNNEYKGNTLSESQGLVGGKIGGRMTREMVKAFEEKLVDK